MNKTKIEWTRGADGSPGYTWNPIVGCSACSAGCANCYAAAISRRFHLPWGRAHFLPERLSAPAKVKKPGKVFVCSMSDLGHETVLPEWREAVRDAMIAAPWHTYIVLTKRPGFWLRDLPTNVRAKVWCGVTIESQEHMDRWLRLLECVWPSCPVRFVSVEPILGPVQFGMFINGPDWVIAGPETGPSARPFNPGWIEALAAQSPCFFDKRKHGGRREWPAES